MAKKSENMRDELSSLIADSINKKYKDSKIAYFMDGQEDIPSDFTDFISSGIDTLDFKMSNRKNGGFPIGRIVELTGQESSGKTLLATHILVETQKRGGIGVYFDTENAYNIDFAKVIGIDEKKLLYIQHEYIENIFSDIEDIITKIRKADTNRLVTIVVDSVAGATTIPEGEAEYTKDGYATQKAIIMSKALRKITNMIGKNRILLVFTNQLRMKMNAMFSDPYCIDPYTTKIKIKYSVPRLDENEVIEEITLEEFSNKFLNNTDFVTPNIFNVDPDIKVATLDENNKEIFSPIESFVVKESVNTHYTDNNIKVTGNHRFIENGNEIKAKYHPDFKLINEPMRVVDIEVPETESYLANGRLNHNTTSGGRALGFHSSIRLRIRGMGKVKGDINGVKQVIGMKTSVEVQKSRCGPPHRKAEFVIYFDRGADNYGSWLTAAKEYDIIKSSGAWYSHPDLEDKFQSKDFVSLLESNPEWKEKLYNQIADMLIIPYNIKEDQEGRGIDDIEIDNKEIID